ncbi:MAG: hypothetical protein ACXVHW_03475 [Methanobacterium sp.]
MKANFIKILVFFAVVLMVCGAASASITPPSGPPGPTKTIGFWKTHSDNLTSLLPNTGISLGNYGGEKSVLVTSPDQAVEILQMNGDSSNGINKLYAQLLAAKLNLLNGANKEIKPLIITEIDPFLSTYDAADWSSLNKKEQNQVLDWMTALDDYNNKYDDDQSQDTKDHGNKNNKH